MNRNSGIIVPKKAIRSMALNPEQGLRIFRMRPPSFRIAVFLGTFSVSNWDEFIMESKLFQKKLSNQKSWP